MTPQKKVAEHSHAFGVLKIHPNTLETRNGIHSLPFFDQSFFKVLEPNFFEFRKMLKFFKIFDGKGQDRFAIVLW